jgi:hypothetical protein
MKNRMPVGSEDSWSPGGDGVVCDRRRARPEGLNVKYQTESIVQTVILSLGLLTENEAQSRRAGKESLVLREIEILPLRLRSGLKASCAQNERNLVRPRERNVGMDRRRKNIRRLTGCLRWAARIAGTAMLALIVLVGAGEIWSGQGLPNPFSQPPGVAAEVIAFVACLAGLILAWRWLRLGGLLLAAGVLTFHIVECKIWLNWVFLVLELVGATHLCVWALDRRYLAVSRKD